MSIRNSFYYAKPFYNPRSICAMTPGQRIRRRRKEMGLNQGELAGLLGISQGTLSDIERGDTKLPSAEVLLKMSEVMKVTQAWIVAGKDGTLSIPTKQEQNLLSAFKELSNEQQLAVLAIISSMK